MRSNYKFIAAIAGLSFLCTQAAEPATAEPKEETSS